MKKLLVILCLLGGVCFGLEQKMPDPNSEAKDKAEEILAMGFTLEVANDAIHSKQVIDRLREHLRKVIVGRNYEQFEEQASGLVYTEVRNRIDSILLYLKAKEFLAVDNPVDDIIANIRRAKLKDLIGRFGGNEAYLRSEITKSGADIEELLDSAVRDALISNYRDVYFKTHKVFSRSDMKKYYDGHEVEFTFNSKLRFRLIDIRFEKVEDREELDEITNKLLGELNNGADFKAMVKKYSTGYLKNNEGLWPDAVRIDFGNAQGINERYQGLMAELIRSKVGDYTGIVYAGDRLFVGKLLDYQKGEMQSFSQSQFEIKGKLKEQEWDKQMLKFRKEIYAEATMTEQEIIQFCRATMQLAYHQINQEEASNAKQ